MKRRWKALVLLLVLSGAPAVADSKLEPPELSRYVRWGPLRMRPGLEVKNVGYDNNILVGTADPVGDYTATVSPQLQGLVLFGSRAFVTFTEKLDLAGYLEHSDLNYVNQRGSARITVPRERVGLFADVVLNRINERPVDQEDLRPRSDESGLALGLIVQPGWRTEIEIGRATTDWRYTDDDNPVISLRLDRDVERNFMSMSHRIGGRSRLTLDADLRFVEFRHESATAKDSRAWSILPGVRFAEGGKLTGTARVGWADIEPEDRSLPDLEDFIADTELAYRPNPRTTIQMRNWRAPGFTVSGTDVYYLETQSRLSLKLYLTRIFGFEVGGGIGKLTFPGSQRLDRLNKYDAAVLMGLSESAIGRRIEYRLGFQHYRRDSSVPSENYSTTQLGLSAVVGF